MNRVVLIGRLTRDIELKSTPSGKSTTTFTLAVDRGKKNGESLGADFITCVAWERKAELLNTYTKKGSQIGLEGRIQTRNYDSNGRTVYVTEVVADEITLLGSKDDGYSKPAPETQYANTKPVLDITADDLPF